MLNLSGRIYYRDTFSLLPALNPEARDQKEDKSR